MKFEKKTAICLEHCYKFA